MELMHQSNREIKYAILCALAAGLFSTLLIAFFFYNFLELIFVPIVMLTVFTSAYFGFRREMRGKRPLNGKRSFQTAMGVGTVTHFSTFALYFLVKYLIYDYQELNLNLFGKWVGASLALGFISLFMFVWIAVPMYMGMGYIMKASEENRLKHPVVYDDSIIDDFQKQDEIEPINQKQR